MKTAFAVLTLAAGLGFAHVATATDALPLKNAFAGKFRVGVAIGTEQIMSAKSPALGLAGRQFDSITPENLLKWAEVHPQPAEYNFEPADRFVKFGEDHGMFIVGHNLVWHNQTPDWVFKDDSGKPLTRDALVARMRDHIHRVVGRYKGRIKAWDVVNEGVEEDGTLRKTKWREIIGDDYIEKAFRFAHEADPDAELYYNDYNEWQPAKKAGIIKLVKDLKAKGVRIDGVGLQGHWGLDYPKVDEIETMFNDYGKLGVKLMITELDVTVLPDGDRHRGADITRNVALRKEIDPYAKGLPANVERELNDRYAEIFGIFLKHADKIDRVTLWGVDDGQSWRNGWPVRGRTDYPLLFDRQFKPKSALNAVLGAARKK